MYTALAFALLSIPQPQPGAFKVDLDGPADVVITLNGQTIKPGKVYTTEPLYKDQEVTIKIRYVNYDRVETKIIPATISPGELTTLTLTIKARALVAWV
jgi:hypothetical protein